MGLFLDLWWFFKREKKSYCLGILFLILVSVLTLLPPYVVGVIVDHILEGTLTLRRLSLWLLLLLTSGVLVYFLRLGWRILIFGASLRLGRYLRNRLYEQFASLDASFYQKERIGDLLAHATNDVQAVEATAGEGILTLVDSLTLGGVVIIVMLTTIHAPLTVIALIPLPLIALATSYYGKRLHRNFLKAQEAFAQLNNQVQENISGLRVIKAFGQEEREKDNFRQQTAHVVEKNIAVAKIDSLYDPTISLVVGLSFFLAVSAGAWFIVQGKMTVGELTTFTMYLGLLVWPMLAFGWLFNILERGRASYDRIQRLLAEKPTEKEEEGGLRAKPGGDLHFSITSFTYPGTKEAALKNIHFILPEGSWLGITGPTGAGKTTLVRLLLRQFELEEGEILIGGRSIKQYTKQALRSSLGYVPQDQFLFSASIAENIAFAKPEATRKEIVEAARAAALHGEILSFEQGYETLVGERGITLSGGQKQRIAIARALLVDPDILILDDALSALDAETEAVVLDNLRRLRQDKTTIIISHRLSQLQMAHTIIVLHDGQITEMGHHDQLMANEGWYRNLYEQQTLEGKLEGEIKD